MYIVANNITKEVLDISGKYNGPEPDDTAVIASVNTESKPESEFSIFRTFDEKIYEDIKIHGESFEPIWDGATITGLDFDVPDQKIFMDMQFDKTIIQSDMIDHVNVTITMYEYDMETPHTDFNGILPLTIIGPPVLLQDGSRSPETLQIGFEFVNGVSHYKFFGYEVGEWHAPAYTDGQYVLMEDKLLEVVP
jgi:hypothetical protein